MAKLSTEDWVKARAKWERSKTLSFESLAKDLGVSRPAVSNRAKAENWTRKVTDNAEKVTAKVTHEVTGALNVENNENLVKLHTIRGKYQETYPDVAYRLCLMGATNAELAEHFKVDVKTIHNWRDAHEEFDKKVEAGKDFADSLVAESMFKSAMGFHTITEITERQSDGENNTDTENNNVVVLKSIKGIPPNYSAQSFWLRNRQPKKWKEKIELEQELNVNVFPPTDKLNEISQKTLEEAATRFRPLITDRMKRLGIELGDNLDNGE